MTDPRERFSTAAGDYARFRPSYPDALIDWIVREAALKPGADVVDVGAGTGISTRLFAKRGFSVVGVEPNDAMRAQAEQAGGARYVKGQAEATGLPSGCADLVAAGQCFHWFDATAAIREFARLARPGGRACAFWNLRKDTPVLRDYDAVLRRFAKDYGTQPHGRETFESLKARRDLQGPRCAVFSNSQAFDLPGLLGRAHSMSYVAVGVDDRLALDRALEEVFERHEKDGAVTFDYDACAVLWTP